MEIPPPLGLTSLFIFLSLVLVFMNAFFVASEFAIVKVRRTRLEELSGQGNAAAKASILCVDNLDEYLSATQLGITLVSLALGWIGEDAFFGLLMHLMPERFAGASGALHAAATGISFFIITLMHVVLGELVPKSMAIQRAERITLRVSKPLRLFHKAARPLIHAFSWLANFILRRMGYHGMAEPPLSEDELKLVMKESKEDGVISESEAQIIHRAFSFSDKRVRDIMISAERVEYFSLQRTFAENMAIARRHMHTRFPVTANGLGTVLGVVHMKDVVHLRIVSAEREAWGEGPGEGALDANAIFTRAMRPPVFVDPGMREDQLMRLLKHRRAHLAIVQDPKTKANLGIVTMEDILEEIVGEILDEHGN